MPEAVPIADLVISVATALGLWVVRAQIAPQADGLPWRFRLILLLAALFYLVRAAGWMIDIGLLRMLTFSAAAALPFAALILAEGMVRRHAPRWVKYGALTGLIVFVGVALTPLVAQLAYQYAFLAFQAALFGTALWLLLTRDRATLSPPENKLCDRVAMIGPLFLVFVATDYGVIPGIPALSGLAALAIAWLASTAEARVATGPFLALTLGITALAAVLLALAIGVSHGLTGAQMIDTAAMLAAVLLAFLVWLSSAALRRARARTSLATALEQTRSLGDYLSAMRRDGLADGFTFLQADDLPDYDAALLGQTIGARGGLSRANLPTDPSKDSLAESQIRSLLDRFAAREILLVAQEPLHIAIGTPAGLAQETGTDIRAAFAIARLIAERDIHRETSV